MNVFVIFYVVFYLSFYLGKGREKHFISINDKAQTNRASSIFLNANVQKFSYFFINVQITFLNGKGDVTFHSYNRSAQ